MGLMARLNKLLSGESKKKKTVKVGQFTKADKRGKVGQSIRVGQIGKASKRGQFDQKALEEELKGSVDKEKLMERIQQSNGREYLAEGSNKPVNFEDTCFEKYDIEVVNGEVEITKPKDSERKALKELQDEIDVQKNENQVEVEKASKAKSRTKGEKDKDLEL